MAGGPQILAPIAKYARNNLDDAPVVGERGRALPPSKTWPRLPAPFSRLSRACGRVQRYSAAFPSPTFEMANSARGSVRSAGATRYLCKFSYIATPSIGSSELIELHPMRNRAFRSTALQAIP